jgi:hypothetical protein
VGTRGDQRVVELAEREDRMKYPSIKLQRPPPVRLEQPRSQLAPLEFSLGMIVNQF